MMKLIKKFSNSIIIVSIILILLGLIFIIYPDMSLKGIGIIIASYMIIQGIIICIFDFQIKGLLPIDGLFAGLISIILGIIIFLKPTSLTTLLTIILGIYIISSSINYIRLSINLKDEDIPWILMLIIGTIDLMVGILIVVNPFQSSVSITIFIGVILIIHAICNIIDTITFRININKIKKFLEY